MICYGVLILVFFTGGNEASGIDLFFPSSGYQSSFELFSFDSQKTVLTEYQGYFEGSFPDPEKNTDAGYTYSNVMSKISPVPDSGFPLSVKTGISPIMRGNLAELEILPFKGRVFGQFFGEWDDQEKNGESPLQYGFKTSTFGGILGQDRMLGNNVLWGFGVQGEKIRIDPVSSDYGGNINSLSGLLHLSIFGSLWYTDLAIGVAKNWNENSMRYDSGVFKNKFDSTQWNYEGEFGLKWNQGYTKIEPFAKMRIISLQEPGTAGLFPNSSQYIPLSYSKYSYRLMLGSRFLWKYSTFLADICPSLQGFWSHEFGDMDIYTNDDNFMMSVAYRFGNNRVVRDRLNLGAGITAALKESLDLYFYYNSTLAKDYTKYSISAGFNKKF